MISESGESATLRVDLDAAVHRPRVHDLLPGPQPLGRDAPARRVLAEARDEVRARLHPFVLHAEDVDDVGVADRLDVRRRLRRQLARQQRRRADERRPDPDERERLQQRARDARVEDVADDRDVQPFEPAELLPQRVEVEQRLRRVLVLPVAGVDDVRVGDPRDELRRPDLRVPDHDHVGVVGAERERRVLERLALVHRGADRLDVERVRREPLRGELERGRGAGRGLVEEVDDRGGP